MSPAGPADGRAGPPGAPGVPGSPSTTSLLVIAKSPAPGRAKTRLCPPCTPAQATELAWAALADTLAAAAATPAARHLLVLEGPSGRWVPPPFETIAQRGNGLAERLAAAFDDVDTPALLVGMDTPQLGPAALSHAMAVLARPGVDAVLGPACDGGYWAIGLRRPDPGVFDGVPMSSRSTATIQRRRLDERRLRTVDLPTVRDVDVWDDALAVAAQCAGSRFGREVDRVLDTWSVAPAAGLGGLASATQAPPSRNGRPATERRRNVR